MIVVCITVSAETWWCCAGNTGVGVVSSSGRVLGEAVHSQLPVHLK